MEITKISDTSFPANRKKSGAAMVLVLCVMAMFTALALTILLSASVITGNVSREAINKRCQIAAVSLSEVLDKEITVDESTNEPVRTFHDFIRSHMDGEYGTDIWHYYCEDSITHSSKEEAIHRFSFSELSLRNNEKLKELLNDYDLEIVIYWKMTKETMDRYESTSDIKRCNDSELVINVTCSKNQEIYMVSSVYALNIDEPEDVTDAKWDDVKWVWTQIWKE